MRKVVSILFVLTFIFSTNFVFAEDNISSETKASYDKNGMTNYIEINLEEQEESIIEIGDKTLLGNNIFEYQGKQGQGTIEKINLDDIIDPEKPTIDPMTGEPLNFDLSLNVVIGDDGRRHIQNTSFMPYRALTYIQFENLFSGWSCSGGVIGEDLVVTNAHCVDRSILRATVPPGMNNSEFAFGFYRVTHIVFPEEYRGVDGNEFDYAILKVAPDDDGNHIGTRAGILSWSEAGTVSEDAILKTYGYPGDKMDESGISLWGMVGRSDSYIHPSLLFYDMDTYFGQSGSPVLNLSDTMIAVHNAGYKFTEGSSERLINGGPKIRRDFTNLFNEMNQ